MDEYVIAIILRLSLTPSLVLTKNLLYLVIILIFLDLIDSSFLHAIGKFRSLKNDEIYQKKDKLIDLLQYVFFIAIVKEIDEVLYSYLIIFFMWRLIGVILYKNSKFGEGGKYLFVFFDFIKEMTILYYLTPNYKSFLFPCIIGKIIFEYFMHIKK